MYKALCISGALVFGVWEYPFADSTDSRVTAAPPTMSATDKHRIGRIVCGEGRFELTTDGLRCSSCPDFTGNAGSDEGMKIAHILHGRFTGARAEGEWILDTEGCEAHLTSFGGSILLGPASARSIPGSPALALGSSLASKPVDRPLSFIFYRPGFRLNDCLIFGKKKTRALLVCNEADMAQGEVFGHISAMEISKRGITRWRLLRWYDNSTGNMADIVSVVPTRMKAVQLDSGPQQLRITVKITGAVQKNPENSPVPPEKSINLKFQRKGQRLFATPDTQRLLGETNLLTGKMLD